MKSLKMKMRTDNRTAIEIESGLSYTSLAIEKADGLGGRSQVDLSDRDLADLIEVLITVRKSRERK